jgi:E3 SUMO-protein ligase PIAS1
VTIEPDGKWLLPAPQSEERSRPQPESSFIEDDDLVIGHVSSRQSNTATPSRSGYAFGTPIQGSSREGSSIAAPRSTTSNKRPAAEVIDLTFSDDEDPEPRPVKRMNTSSTSFNGYSNGWSGNG